MNRIRKLQRTAQIARAGKISPVLIAMSEHTSRGDTLHDYSIPVAMGSLLPYNETQSNAWIRIDAITEVADLIAKVKSTGSNDPLGRDLCRFGSIVPVWSVKDRTSIGDQIAAQAKINNLIRVNAPSMDDVISVYLYIADLADRYKTVIDILDLQEMLIVTKAYELDEQWPEEISKQKAMLAAINIHFLPPSLIDDSTDYKQHETYQDLQHLDDRVVDTTNLVAHISTSDARISREWPALSNTARLVFWEIKAISKANENARFSAAASLLYVTALCRGGSVTDAWVNSRAARLETEANVNNLAALLPPELILKFFNTYPRDVMSEEDVYGALLASYTLFENNNFRSLMWIVEQSAAQNIAPATALADIISRTKGVDVDYLMDMIPFSQFQAVAELVANIIYNRFCSLSKTPVHQARYADLAYIGVVLQFYGLEPNKTTNQYKGKPGENATLSTPQLIAIAKHVRDSASAMIERSSSLHSRLQRLIGGADVIADNDGLFIVPTTDQYVSPTVRSVRTTLATMHNPDVVLGAAAHADDDALEDIPFLPIPRPPNNQQDLETFKQDIRQKRSAWPRKFKNLPDNAIFVSEEEIQDKLLQLASPSAKAFKRLMERLHTIAMQSKLNPIAEDKIKSYQAYTALSVDDQSDLQTLRVPIKQNWVTPPAPRPDITLDPQAGKNLILYYRPIGAIKVPNKSNKTNQHQTPPPPPPHAPGSAYSRYQVAGLNIPQQGPSTTSPGPELVRASNVGEPSYKPKSKPTKRRSDKFLILSDLISSAFDPSADEIKEFLSDELESDATGKIILPPTSHRFAHLIATGYPQYNYKLPSAAIIVDVLDSLNIAEPIPSALWSYGMLISLPTSWCYPIEKRFRDMIADHFLRHLAYSAYVNEGIRRAVVTLDYGDLPFKGLENVDTSDVASASDFIDQIDLIGVEHDIFVTL